MEMKYLEALFCNERFVMTAVVLNTLVMFLGGFWRYNIAFEISDATFTIIFLCEAIVKINKFGWNTYWQKNWNRFDFIVLIIALPSLMSLFMEETLATNVILGMRSMRLFKSFKILHCIPNIQKLLRGIKLAFNASLIVFFAFFLLLIIFSLLTSAIFGKISPEYFGNPGISLYSIFRLFTVEGWYELPDAIAKTSTPMWGLFARCYFSALMFLGGIIGMSLITSIFVDAMAEDNNDEVMEKLKQIDEKLKEIAKN